ncbi:MAG: DUF3667 domain-containing protein [Bacteroidetes bacterium]|nr:DUF3667 domain-containing protein [Bacteroidota bacterium]MCL2301775.1 DUF3667 domain-containing protein [Lentimicrobiaceae bacterium]
MRWFKKKKRTLPEDTTCRNCGVQTVGRYCHECGQDVHAGTGQSTLKLIGQALESAFALDGKAPRTLAFLMIRPGFMSEEYRAGRVNRYVHPVRLFWMSTLIFFALLISQINFGNADVRIAGEQMTGENASMIINYFAKLAPYVTFLLIPMFALLLALFFWRKKDYYMYHMIFTLHFHTFLWIFCSLLLIIGLFTRNVTYPGWLSMLLFFTPGVYLTMALRRYYQTKSWWQALWKAILISLLYFLLILLVTGLVLLFVVKVFFPELMES